ncbi:MAG: DUF1800 domain-containing protein, partial [Armatimonadota bacterium]|nr:DUF1800 domain-containing protein [Armatimonadota bacterium]
MNIGHKNKARVALGVAALCGAGGALTGNAILAAPARTAKTTATAAPARALTEDQKIVHVLNRLGFGPRPGDVEKVRQMGLQRYIGLQLTPEKIPDTATEQKVAAFPQLQLSDDQLAELYQARTVAYANSRRLRKQLLGQSNKAATPPNGTGTDAADPAKNGKKNLAAITDPQERQEAQTARQELRQAALPVSEAQEQFVEAKTLRAVDSQRQLQEVLVDFWSNHFNIDVRKASCGILKIADDRDAIRPHVLGKFRDLLGASAKSPAMLVYLDNFQSTSDTPGGMLARRRARPAAAPAKKKRGGLNENYGREIMELHTLGVDGGYTQKDVTEVARCFTGWSIGQGDAGGRRGRLPGGGKYGAVGTFHFYPALHDDGAKVVLGHVIPAGGGITDGEKVLDILASNPATMRHLSTELCLRFVSDTPPPLLIDKCVTTWKRTDGDLREVVRTIVTSPEFYAPAAYRSKIKSPFEYAVSSIRALGGVYRPSSAPQGRGAALNIKPPKGGGFMYLDTTSLVGQIGTMGQPLFQYQAPTGYPEDSKKWVSSGALISRMNYALT